MFCENNFREMIILKEHYIDILKNVEFVRVKMKSDLVKKIIFKNTESAKTNTLKVARVMA